MALLKSHPFKKNHIMKRIILIISILLISITAEAQSWQWGKRGGSTDNLGINYREEVQSMVTDSQNNIYIISSVGKNELDVDGVTKTYYGDPTTIVDVVVASFSCDGTYRWSKIIGGANWDDVDGIQVDSQDNIYIAGRFGSCGDTMYPPRIENDVIISQTPQDCSLIFLAKFNSNGDMLWFKRPQLSTVSFTEGYSHTNSAGLDIDAFGNTYWLVSLPAGVYANGAFTTTLPGAQPGLTLLHFKV